MAATVDDLVKAHTKAKSHRVEALMMPEFWTAYKSPHTLVWNRVQFGVDASVLPNNKVGVYCFVIEPGIAALPCCGLLVYIGRAKTNFRRRYSEYLEEKTDLEGRIKVVVMLNQWSKHLAFYYAELPTKEDAASEENRLLTAFVPEFNSILPARVAAKSGAF